MSTKNISSFNATDNSTFNATDSSFNAAYKSVINPADALVENGSLRNQVTKRYWVCWMSVMYCVSGELRGSSGRSDDYLEDLDARRSS